MRRWRNIINGIVNIWKPAGITSHGVVNRVRRILNIKKVGHTGTLDPMAEGVLPVCIGKATRAADLIMGAEKGYRAVMKLGITTDTEDTTGNILQRREVSVSDDAVKKAAEAFTGEIYQAPPMYSAVHYEGKRLYELARQGKVVEREKRKINIFSIDAEKTAEDEVTLSVICSKGTYIRTLCADIGEALGCGAAMSALTRTKTGIFSADSAVTLEDFEKEPQKYIIPIDSLFKNCKSVVLDAADEKRVKTGLSPRTGINEGEICRLYSKDGSFLCISRSIKTDNGNIFKMMTGFYEV